MRILIQPLVRPLGQNGLGNSLCLILDLLSLTGCEQAPPENAIDFNEDPTTQKPLGGVFKEVTTKARLDFAHQLADGKLSNIMESAGAGGTFLEYDGDSLMDVYLVNSDPDEIISEAPPDTPRTPNHLYRNRGDGTFEDP